MARDEGQRGGAGARLQRIHDRLSEGGEIAGDDPVFDDLLAVVKQLVRVKATRGAVDVSSVAHSVFMACVAGWSHPRVEGLPPPDQLVRWIARVAEYRIIDRRRREQRRGQSRGIGPAAGDGELLPADDKARPPSEILAVLEEVDLLEMQLAEVDRRILYLVSAGLTFPQIAEIVGLNTEAVKKRGFRARKALRQRSTRDSADE